MKVDLNISNTDLKFILKNMARYGYRYKSQYIRYIFELGLYSEKIITKKKMEKYHKFIDKMLDKK